MTVTTTSLTGSIDWGNPSFLRLYGLVFGLSSVLTMVMWLISVVKRAVRGIPIGQAAMENVGYLLLSVVVAGFAPVAVAYTVDIVDAAAWAILREYIIQLFAGGVAIWGVLSAITVLAPGFGLVVALPIGTMILLAVFGLWVMLVVRNAMILMGLVFGPLVFSGLVDKDLWGHTRKWAGIMGGIIASKLGIYLALALAGAIFEDVADPSRLTLPRAIGGSITFVALLFLALFMPFQIAKWLPFVGDELQAMHGAKEEAGQRAKQVKMKSDDMKAQAAKKQSSGGGPQAAGNGAAGAAAGPAAAAVAVKQAADEMRDQTVQAAQDGASNAAGDGGPQGGGSSGSSGGAGGGSGQGGSPRGGGQGGGRSGGGGSSGGRRSAPPPPPPRAGSRGAPPPPPPPPRSGGQAPPPPPPPPPGS
ncbi:hypothetical protein ACFU8W_48465 [Streptomyces sp. NPDC057565]|uniref:hypothetical protein n=1 Tax=Streptomyces sp. NPDC057565 TaxID=3346169 RepID=UPI0036C9A428